ncbi:uncharacterized protein LOC143292570 [Babylonia areolata]|uniref:uncharacterized protein LOC143292570 n=1 Tax=Babylonia areolata TaxID=304850 RepID=UPI003FD5D141
MCDGKETTIAATVSNAQQIPRKTSVKLDLESSQGASYISQKSDSVETLGTSSPAHSDDENFHQSGLQDSKNNSAVIQQAEDSTTSADARTDLSANFQHWLKDEMVPSRSLLPAHHSNPQDDECLSVVSEEGSNSSEGEHTRELFLPGDLHTPILGFEIMEARSKFTVYKIHVEKTASDIPPSSWFVFRRFSDFVHLNDKLRQLFPAFQLALPPKRWVRDNFDKDFLDRRRLGLQLFLDNITGHRDMCNSQPVRDFFCTDDPPGPHDSLEESRALCDLLEESLYNLRQDLQEKNSEIDLLKDELEIYKSQVQLLTKQLRLLNHRKTNGAVCSSASGSADDLDVDCNSPFQSKVLDKIDQSSLLASDETREKEQH